MYDGLDGGVSGGWMVVCGQKGDKNGVKMVWVMLVMADESER